MEVEIFKISVESHLYFRIVEFHLHLFSRVFKIWQWFLVQKKAEYSYFEMEKFFIPLFYIGDSLKIEFEHANYQYSKQKRGVKNFCIFWSNISAFICTKNHCLILKTHENSYSGVICSNHSKSGKKVPPLRSIKKKKKSKH